MTRAPVLLFPAILLSATLLLPSAAAAQPYESNLRFGLGLDYAGLVGREGGVGGLRLSLGARVHEHIAFYYQGQALAGAFVSPDDMLGMFVGWNAAMAEASYGIFQVAAGPSLDLTVRCDIDTTQDAWSGVCADYVAPGLATRAGLRFGILALSGDLHVTFNEAGPDVFVVVGLGIQLGDVAREPMLFPSTHRSGSSGASEVDSFELPAREGPPPPVQAYVAAPSGRLGLRLADPGWERPTAAAPSEPRAPLVETPERARAPVVRRFTRRDASPEPAPRRGEARRPARPRSTTPDLLQDTLELEDGDDPIGGLDEL